jgi:hypothetical protein
LICDRLFDKLYYDQVLFISISDGLDKTMQTIEGEFKTKIEFVSDANILQYLQRLMKKKTKFYALIRCVKFHKITCEMERLITEK